MAKTKKINKNNLPSEETVEKIEMLTSLLSSISIEMEELSKKKPNEPLNKLKVKMINKILEQTLEILVSEPTISFLELLDDSSLPSNSDAVLVVGQFKSAMDQFKQKYHGYDYATSEHRWFTITNP